MAASDVAIANRALNLLGLNAINSLSQNNQAAATMANAYPALRRRLIRAHRWHFAKRRAQVAADPDQTLWGGLNRYLLPNDFLRLLRDSDQRRDWKREGRYIITADAAPLEFLYLADIQDTTLFDSSFDEALAHMIAFETCHKLTGSTGMKQDLRSDFREVMIEAKRTNAFESDADDSFEDDWVLVRL